MVNDTTLDSELDLQVTDDSESVETSQDSQDAEGEIEGSKLNLETSESKVDKLSTAEENAVKQVEHWMLEVTSGRKALEDAPAWVQKRMLPKLEGAQVKEEDIVLKVSKQIQEDADFNAEKATLPTMTPGQAEEFKRRYAELRPAGRLAAIRAVKDAMGLSSKVKEAEQRGIAKGRMSLPRSGQPSVKKSEQTIAGVPVSTITNDAEWRKMLSQAKE